MVNLYLLRAMEKARYDLVDVGHFGLGYAGYAHFTSPIRRYADLANHRIVKRYLLDGSRPGGDPWAFADGWMSAGVASHISSTEMTADDAERAVLKMKAVRYARLRIGEEARGTIVGLSSGGLFVFPRGMVPSRDSSRSGRSAIHRSRLRNTGSRSAPKRTRNRYGLGDPVDVVVARADLERREIELACGRARRDGQSIRVAQRKRRAGVVRGKRR